MPELADLLTDDDLRRQFGTPTFVRAAEYVARGNVVSSQVRSDQQGEWILTGSVTGTSAIPYRVTVDIGYDGGSAWLSGRCTCPVVADCKHVLAVVLTARDAEPRGAATSRWETQLDRVLDELEGPMRRERPTEPLGLMVELSAPVARGYREWAGAALQRGAVRLRPVRRGLRGAWVKTGVSWGGLKQLESQGFRGDHAALLDEMLTGYRAASRMSYYGAEEFLPVSAFGPLLWQQLARARELGVEIVAGKGLAAVAVAEEPVLLQLDANSGAEGDVHLELGVLHDTEWYSSADLDVLGADGHGVVLFQHGDGDPAVTLAALAKPAGPALRRLLAAPESLVVPSQARGDLVGDYLPRLQRHLGVVSSDESVHVPPRPLPRLALTVDWRSVSEVALAWSFRYRVGGDDRSYGVDDARGLRGVRDPEAEAALLDELELTDEESYRLRTPGGRLLNEVVRDVAAIGIAEILPGLEASDRFELEEVGIRPDYRELLGVPEISFAPRGDSPGDRPDWLDLEVIVTVDGHFVGLAQLLEALTRGHDRIILRNGRHLRVDRPEFAQLAELVAAAAELQEQPRDGIAVHKGDLGLWDELADVGIVDAQAGDWVRAAQALRGLVTLPEVDPTGLQADLRPYQRDGFRWLAFLWESQLGGILADDMGLGKTLQTLALFGHARARGAAPFLVVAPTSVVSSWAHEASTFTPGLRVRTVTESHARRGEPLAAVHADADVVVTSYTLLRLEIGDYEALDWGGLVLDEAQAVKNHRGKTYQAVRRLHVPFRLALTGTPLENRLMELWSLLSIVAPGLYPWPQRFSELVADPVEKEGDAEVLDRFRRRIRPFLLRRTKELVAADLPPKQEQVLEVQLTPRHRKLYDTHLQRERQNVLGLVEEDFEKHRITIFRSLTRLRQLSLDAGLVDPAYDDVGSAKLDVLVDHLQEVVAEGHRALVFSQFTSFLTRARRRLDAEGIESRYLDGRTRDRAGVISDFKRGSGAVFLISLKAGGVGLTLTEADYVFVLDPWWNPAVEAQAVDRAHRIGQKKPVMVYRLVSERTIEEKVMELKARKAALFAKVVDGGGGAGTPITAADVRALFEE
ncbi:MAG TPA: DEAD/DEAH box helicase [Nocardioidaceae bacterium]|nr:DEAD/DEAH box helicase [Nocardioidaceae bacterium]